MSMINGYGNFLGYSTLTMPIPIPSTSSYIKLILDGSLNIDNIHVKNTSLSEVEFNAIDEAVTPTWDLDTTLMLATFDDETLNAGVVGYLPELVDGWEIFRKATNEAKFTKLATLGKDSIEYNDYLVYNRETFVYNIVAKAGAYLSAPLESNPVLMGFDDWFLINDDDAISYKFCLNMNIGTTTTNEDFYSQKTFGKYDTVSIGNRNYKSGSISVILEEAINDGVLEQPVNYLETFRLFIKDGKEKILKSPKGEIYRVSTNGYSEQVVNTGDYIQSYRVSFRWQEVGDMA